MTLLGLTWYEWLCLIVLTYSLSWIAYPYFDEYVRKQHRIEREKVLFNMKKEDKQ